ncbi:hypothetical protein ABIB62_003015 [Mucilaginibacter sp. UYP25]|uniref:hypothetical protein n=1 Tax=unclassified Mucilaginibacter TaxID=2617802 RepID=UPI0033917C1D
MHPLSHIKPLLKTGNEGIIVNGKVSNHTLLDFWRWNVSDILSNATRGRLAEFLVALATNIDIKEVREEWGPYDLTTPEGIKLEIKSAAYLQSWEQNVVSKISFSTKLARAWDWEVDKRSAIAKRHADVYVFCLLKHEDKQTINPLDLTHWDFYVLSTTELNKYERSQHSITLNSLKRHASAIGYNELLSEIVSKNELNHTQA